MRFIIFKMKKIKWENQNQKMTDKQRKNESAIHREKDEKLKSLKKLKGSAAITFKKLKNIFKIKHQSCINRTDRHTLRI